MSKERLSLRLELESIDLLKAIGQAERLKPSTIARICIEDALERIERRKGELENATS